MLRRLYIAISLVSLAPIWSVRYLPTADGPAHLYNAWLLKTLIAGDHGVVHSWFTIRWLPFPNWTGHALLAALMTVVPPLIAEKILVSGIALLFLCAMWMYSEGRPWCFFAVPFTYNLLLQAGFYNFSIGCALYFVIVAIWWRRREQADWRTIAIIAVLLIVCYFSHPMPAALAVGSIGLLWVFTRRDWRHLIAFVPVIPLFVFFVRSQGPSVVTTSQGPWGLFSYVMRMWVILTFDDYQARLGLLLFVVLVVLAIATFIRPAW